MKTKRSSLTYRAFSLIEIVVASTMIGIIFVSLSLFFHSQTKSFSKEKQAHLSLKQQILLFQTLSYCFYNKAPSTPQFPTVTYEKFPQKEVLSIIYQEQNAQAAPLLKLEVHFDTSISLIQKQIDQTQAIQTIELSFLSMTDIRFFSANLEDISPYQLTYTHPEAIILQFINSFNSQEKEFLIESPLFFPSS